MATLGLSMDRGAIGSKWKRSDWAGKYYDVGNDQCVSKHSRQHRYNWYSNGIMGIESDPHIYACVLQAEQMQCPIRLGIRTEWIIRHLSILPRGDELSSCIHKYKENGVADSIMYESVLAYFISDILVYHHLGEENIRYRSL